jgi:hypothetical protein
MDKLNRAFSGWIQILICLITGVSLGGCGELFRPPLHTILHQPEPSLKTKELRPANVTVRPLQDERQVVKSRVSWNVCLTFIPLVPYATYECQDGPGAPDSGLSCAPGHERDLATLVARYMQESIAAEVKLGEYDPAADFFVEPVLVKWKRIDKMSLYGLSVIGGVLVMYIGTPFGYQSWEVDFSLNLVDASTSKVILSRRYADIVSGGFIPGIGPLAWIYGDYRRPDSTARFPEDIKPFLQESLEDFVRGVQEVLPPSSDKVYWENKNRGK